MSLDQEAIDQRKASEILFKPSSSDEKSPGQRLSVWVEELTLADQGWSIMGSDPAKTVVACLVVDDVLAITPHENFRALEVQWEQARMNDGSINTHPGAEGHAGIAGLCQGNPNGKQDRDRRKALRSQLADKAIISPVPVPHDIAEEQLQVAAYFIAENDCLPDGNCDDYWVAAVRQLRRAKAREHRRS